MNRVTRFGLAALGTWLALVRIGNASAEEEVEYEPTMKQGLHIHDDGRSKSSLALAARRGGSVILGDDMEEEAPLAPQNETYLVKKGDTLWDICARFFNDPYTWPRVWSYNTNRLSNTSHVAAFQSDR